MPLPDNEALFAVVRAWVQRHYPGRLVRKLTLALDGGDKVKLPVPFAPAGEDLVTDEDEPPTSATAPPEMRTAILTTLRQVAQPLKSSTIARRCGRNYTSHFRTVLRTLTLAGEVERLPDGTYRIPQEG